MKLLKFGVNPDKYYLRKDEWKVIKKICDGSTNIGRTKTQDFVNQIKKHCQIPTNKQLIYNEEDRYIGDLDFKTLHFPTNDENYDDGYIEPIRVKDKYSIYLKLVNNSEEWTTDEIRDIQISLIKTIYRKLNPADIYNPFECYEDLYSDVINIDDNINSYIIELSDSDMLSEPEYENECDAYHN